MNAVAATDGQGPMAPTLAAALAFAESRLAAGLPHVNDDRPQLRSEARALLRLAAGLSDAQIYADRGRRLDAGTFDRFRAIVARRAAGEPLAYIEQRRGFHAIDLHVSPDVLVPRPETEIIVDTVIAEAPAGPFSVLDMGTGSGAIALGIAHARGDARVTAVDVSVAALSVARGNAARLGLSVVCIESDWFERLPQQHFDFICCNPPYVRSEDPHFEQLRYEPRLALDGGSDGLRAISRVVAGAPDYLAGRGVLVLEHGFDQAAAVARVAADAGLQRVRTVVDLAGHERVSVFRIRDRREA